MTKNILFLCAGNFARPILAEALATRPGEGRYKGLSAGSNPTGTPTPFAISLLKSKGIDTSFGQSKTWGIPNLAAANGSDGEIAAEFEKAFGRVQDRIEAFKALPEGLDDEALKVEMRDIGQMEGAARGGG